MELIGPVCALAVLKCPMSVEDKIATLESFLAGKKLPEIPKTGLDPFDKAVDGLEVGRPEPVSLKIIGKSGIEKDPACGFDTELWINGQKFPATGVSLEIEAGGKPIEAEVRFCPRSVEIDVDALIKGSGKGTPIKKLDELKKLMNIQSED